jgi:hypothetical protein
MIDDWGLLGSGSIFSYFVGSRLEMSLVGFAVYRLDIWTGLYLSVVESCVLMTEGVVLLVLAFWLDKVFWIRVVILVLLIAAILEGFSAVWNDVFNSILCSCFFDSWIKSSAWDLSWSATLKSYKGLVLANWSFGCSGSSGILFLDGIVVVIEPEAVYRFLRLSELRWLFEAGLRTM